MKISRRARLFHNLIKFHQKAVCDHELGWGKTEKKIRVIDRMQKKLYKILTK